jgi:hypothetical protein
MSHKTLSSSISETNGTPRKQLNPYLFLLKMVGQYAKNNYLQRGLQRFNPYDIISEDILSGTRLANTGVGFASAIPSLATEGFNLLSKAGQMDNALNSYKVVSKLGSVAPLAEEIGGAANVVGGVLGGISLGKDISDAVKDKRVTFDNAMKMADDGTAVVSTAASFIPVIGTGLSLALTGGEKLVTGIIKADKAVKERKKELGVKHLGFDEWSNTVEKAILPNSMTKEIKTKKKNKKKK